MKFISKHPQFWALLCALAAAGLRIWTLSAGEDIRGLYPAGHGGWIGYLILSVAVVIFFLFLSRREIPVQNHPYHKIGSLVCQILAACGTCLYGIGQWEQGGILNYAVALVALAATVLLSLRILPNGDSRRPWAYGISCLLFVLLLFQVNYDFGGEPEMLRFLPQVFAAMTAAYAVYQFWGKSVDLGNRKKQLFWQCLGGFFSIAAAPGNHIVYALVGLWLLSEPLEAAPVCPSEPVEENSDL